MILTNKQIEETYRRGEILIEPFEQRQVEAATYDLRVGSQGVTTTSKKVVDIKEHGFIVISPGDLASLRHLRNYG